MSSYKIKIDRYGTKCYYLNEKLHREDGPSIEFANGEKHWYKNGQRHREDGPAIEYSIGYKEWFLNDKFYGYDNKFTNKSWVKFVKTLIFF